MKIFQKTSFLSKNAKKSQKFFYWIFFLFLCILVNLRSLITNTLVLSRFDVSFLKYLQKMILMTIWQGGPLSIFNKNKYFHLYLIF
jgi:hypothetical protein